MEKTYIQIVKLVEEFPGLLTEPVRSRTLDRLTREFRVSHREAAVFACLFKRQLIDDSSACMKDIRDEHDLDLPHYGELLKICDALREKGLLTKKSDKHANKNPMYPEYELDERVFSRLVLGKDPWGNLNPTDIYSIADAVSRILEIREDGSMSQDKCMDSLREIQSQIPSCVPFFRVFHGLNDTELAFLCYAIGDYLKGTWGSFTSNFSDNVLERVSAKARLLTNVRERRLACIRRGWIELDEEGGFCRDPQFRLSDKAIDVLFSGGKRAPLTFKPEFCHHIQCTDIGQTRLFLTGQSAESMHLLQQSLVRSQLKKLTARLKSKSLPTGITCILHGPPGTGKTASVYQLARRRKMDILHVDFANIRDKYVGESEKRLKAVFDEYKTARKRLKRMPILLFNEADALLSNRIHVSDSVDQMNNSMQNILLEQLERFDGILMATTNLMENLDPAFERRFLFKVKFERPDVECRRLIWKSKLPRLKVHEAELLAEMDLSGAQIENVVRKLTMMEVVGTSKPDMTTIWQLASAEMTTATSLTGQIGFKAK